MISSMRHRLLLPLLFACSQTETKVQVEYFDPPSGHVFDVDMPSVSIINLDTVEDICYTTGGSTAEWGSENCTVLEANRDILLEECGYNGVSISWEQGSFTESANYSVVSPSCENSCDPVLPWANDELVTAFATWQDDVKCLMNNCDNPSGTGSWQANCDAGQVEWNVGLDGLTAVSEFTYENCEKSVEILVHDTIQDPEWNEPDRMTPQIIRLVVNGVLTQRTDFGGNGSESGTLEIAGDFIGQIQSQIEIVDKERGGGAFLAGCAEHPIYNELCAPGEARIQYDVPD